MVNISDDTGVACPVKCWRKGILITERMGSNGTNIKNPHVSQCAYLKARLHDDVN